MEHFPPRGDSDQPEGVKPMHTTKEILEVYGKGNEHSREAAAQAVYNLGLAFGRDDTLNKLAVGDPPTTELLKAHQERAAEDKRLAEDKVADDKRAADLAAREAAHNDTESRKRQAADKARDEEDADDTDTAATRARKSAAADKAKGAHR